MLSFASITPHPPIIIPNIGGENLDKFHHTIQALKQLGGELATQDLDSLIIISPHGNLLTKDFTVNLSPNFSADFKKFGDLVTELTWRGDIVLAQQIKESADNIVYVSNDELDHGVAVPLFYLLNKSKEVPIVPIGFCSLSHQDHFDFGISLGKIIQQSNKKIGVIASGDLSHCLTPEAPGGFSPQGNIFDEKLVSLIKEKDVASILKLDKKFIQQAGECGLRSILVLLGILSSTKYEPQVLSYEGPVGVGYLVVDFKL